MKQYILGKIRLNTINILREYLDNYYKNLLKKFITMLIGRIDGDGYILVSNTGRDIIKLNLVINLHIRDLHMLEFIQSELKFGHIIKYISNKNEYVKYVINKTDLQEIFFLLLEYHNLFFFTEMRRKQYNKAIYILKNSLTRFNNILNEEDILNILLFFNNKKITHLDIKNLSFLDNWLIGFIIADGSFF